MLHAGFGMYYDDLAQNGWATAFQGVNNTNATTGTCSLIGGAGSYALTGAGCLQGGAGATGDLIGSAYKTPYAIHVTGGVQHAFNDTMADQRRLHARAGKSRLSRVPLLQRQQPVSPAISTSDPDYATDQANVVPNVNVFQSDNRSSYNALMFHAARQHASLQPGRELYAFEGADVGLCAGRAV